MKTLLTEIDELLCNLLQYPQGKDEDKIVKMRGKIILALKELETNGKICDHPRTYNVFGAFGGVYCEICKEKID